MCGDLTGCADSMHGCWELLDCVLLKHERLPGVVLGLDDSTVARVRVDESEGVVVRSAHQMAARR